MSADLRSRNLASVVLAMFATPASAAETDPSSWWTWVTIGAIGMVIAGIVVRMILAARFPKDYRAWARERRESFAQRSADWDRADEEFRK
jgi:hypothetical protein